ncbi:hypothetical protein IGI04_014010 [Brassica rapa subsp. trilocularis]|uniref:Uncharacterized protein n=1 Tax=Brassica rapa subsp. trilocularis TaxID=1813537 RepID=A0ABQ7NCA8_BRACM|nr:hypothetical protein IGI04_014010 [Brassica rapa subsp. trilocularis]
MDIKFGVLMFKEIRERLESFRVRNITFLLQSFERKKDNVKYFRPRRLLEDLWKTYTSGNLWKTPGRHMEDFDLGGKPKLFQNLGGNHKFYSNLGGMCLKAFFLSIL